jgi:UDP-GlcNAc:undecaprenyl-phosphate GlcNAc-1-phosphate transferase
MRLAVSDAAVLFALPFALALALSLGLSGLTRRLAWRFGFVALPKADRWHRGTNALLGGLPIWAATLVVVAAVQGFSRETLIVSIGGALALLLGLIDDVDPIKPSGKLGAEIIIACFVARRDCSCTGRDPRPRCARDDLWIVGITNAFNLLDNMDGLCAGVSVIAQLRSAAASARAKPSRSSTRRPLPARRSVPALQFQPGFDVPGRLRQPVSRIHLCLARGRQAAFLTGLISTLIVPVLILLLPIFDTTFVTISRKLPPAQHPRRP